MFRPVRTRTTRKRSPVAYRYRPPDTRGVIYESRSTPRVNRTTTPDRGSATDRVSVAEGIAYGYRTMGYYIGVIVLGQLALGVGLGLIGSGLDVG